MERMKPAASRLADYQRAHPDAVICRVDGVLHAWVPGCSDFTGAEVHADTEDELLGKLAAG